MTPYYEDPWLTIHVGDCRDVLESMPAESVHCVVTSPPYWGLRDYGTASWEGGDPDCPHRVPATGSTQNKGNNNREGKPFDSVCGKCGATRIDRQLGLEPTPEEYVANMVAVFREARRVLRDDGTLWLNLGDSYASTGPGTWGSSDKSTLTTASRNGAWAPGQTVGKTPKRDISGLKPKDLVGIPWRVAFALQRPWLRCRGCGAEAHTDQWGRFPNGRLICPACELAKGHDVSEAGWYLRSDIIWSKPNPMPESVTDRPTKSHEYLFLLTKSARYWYDADAVREPNTTEGDRREGRGRFAYEGKFDGQRDDGSQQAFVTINPAGRNRRSVWTVATQPYPGAHFAVMPEALVEPCVMAGCPDKACGECGAPWERVVERATVMTRPGSASKLGVTESERRAQGRDTTVGLRQRPVTTTTTTGWKPTCDHDAPTVPGVTLDPFGGSGTVARVANRLSRRAVLVDLNLEYLEQQMRRNAGMPLGLVTA